MTPTLPPGFTLDEPQQNSGAPPPPPGFTLDQPQNQDNSMSLKGFGMNAIKDVPQMIYGVGTQLKQGLYDIPKSIFNLPEELAQGQNVRDTSLGKFTTQNTQALGQGLSQIVQHPIQTAYNHPIQTGIAALEGIRAGLPMAADVSDAGAMALGRRSLGFTKRFLNTEGKEANANAATRTALDEGVIQPFSNPETMKESAKNLQKSSGQTMGNIFKERNQDTSNNSPLLFDPQQAINDLDTLRPRSKNGDILNGGDYTPQNEMIDHAIETIKAHGDQPIPWDEANELKSHLQGLATYDTTKSSNVNNLKKAIGGVFKDSLDNQLASATEASGGDTSLFGKAKKTWKSAKDMQTGLQNKISSQQGNNALGITDLLTGGLGGVLGGHFGAEGGTLGALGSIAAKKILSEYGPSTGSYILNKTAKGLRQASQVADTIHNIPGSLLNKGAQLSRDERGSIFPSEQDLPEIQPGSKTGPAHALLAYEDEFGPGGSKRKIYNVFGDPNDPAIRKMGWGSSVPEEQLNGIPIVGKEKKRSFLK